MLETIDKNLSALGEDDEIVLQENKTFLRQKEQEYLLNQIAGNLAGFDAMQDSKSLKCVEIIHEHCVKGK